MSALAKMAVGFCPVGFCPVGFCPSGLLSQWAFVRSPLEASGGSIHVSISCTCIYPYKPGVFLWDIGKQNSPGCDDAKRGVPSGAILFAYTNFIEN